MEQPFFVGKMALLFFTKRIVLHVHEVFLLQKYAFLPSLETAVMLTACFTVGLHSFVHLYRYWKTQIFSRSYHSIFFLTNRGAIFSTKKAVPFLEKEWSHMIMKIFMISNPCERVQICAARLYSKL